MKKCSKCNETKPLKQFGKNVRAKDGLRHSCRECIKIARAKKYADENRKKVVPVDRYGLTQEDIESLSGQHQYTLKCIKEGYYEYLFLKEPEGAKIFRSYGKNDRDAYKGCLKAIRRIQARKSKVA